MNVADLKTLDIIHADARGSLCTLTVRGTREEIEARMEQYHPIFAEIIPLSLEEIFIYELGGEDYAVRDIVL